MCPVLKGICLCAASPLQARAVCLSYTSTYIHMPLLVPPCAWPAQRSHTRLHMCGTHSTKLHHSLREACERACTPCPAGPPAVRTQPAQRAHTRLHIMCLLASRAQHPPLEGCRAHCSQVHPRTMPRWNPSRARPLVLDFDIRSLPVTTASSRCACVCCTCVRMCMCVRVCRTAA